MSNTEISMTNSGWNGDFTQDATGDLVLAADTVNSPTATQQRVYRLLMTNPRTFDQATNQPSGLPDDLFATGYGAGLRRRTGQMITPALFAAIEADIDSGLQQDPTIVDFPQPTVAITNAGNNTVQIDVACTAVSGQVVTVPSFPLPLSGG